jgi:hypothetical protein
VSMNGRVAPAVHTVVQIQGYYYSFQDDDFGRVTSFHLDLPNLDLLLWNREYGNCLGVLDRADSIRRAGPPGHPLFIYIRWSSISRHR